MLSHYSMSVANAHHQERRGSVTARLIVSFFGLILQHGAAELPLTIEGDIRPSSASTTPLLPPTNARLLFYPTARVVGMLLPFRGNDQSFSRCLHSNGIGFNALPNTLFQPVCPAAHVVPAVATPAKKAPRAALPNGGVGWRSLGPLTPPRMRRFENRQSACPTRAAFLASAAASRDRPTFPTAHPDF